jgi:hypothetical protein
MLENRLNKVEAQLTGKQRALAFTHRVQRLGGFVELARRSVDPSCPRLLVDDHEGGFVHEVVGLFNGEVLNLICKRDAERKLLWLCLAPLGKWHGRGQVSGTPPQASRLMWTTHRFGKLVGHVGPRRRFVPLEAGPAVEAAPSERDEVEILDY